MADVIDMRDITLTVLKQEPFRQIFSALANASEACTATATVVGQLVADVRRDDDLVDAVRHLAMANRGYAMAPRRKRPRRVAKKVRARFGVVHHRDYIRELKRWMRTVAALPAEQRRGLIEDW